MRMIARKTGISWLARLTMLLCLAGAWATQCSAAPHDFPCSREIDKFCKTAGFGEGRVQNCLKEHREELSPSCSSKFEASIARHQEIQASCGADIERLCKNVQPGKGRVARCLKEKHREVSSACKEKLAAARKAHDQEKPNPSIKGGSK